MVSTIGWRSFEFGLTVEIVVLGIDLF